jgi:D-aminoacyl-tRNA deacylase
MPLILYTSKNIASASIAKKMIEIGATIEPIDTVSDSVLDIPTDFDTDCIIVLSTHKSKAGNPMLTAHFPGNWDKADMGGKERTLNIADGKMLKRIIHELDIANKKHKLDWPLFIEADHHGPNSLVPIIFVEIGSTEKEWKNEKAAMVVAEAVNNSVRKTQDSELETVFCIGGGHYSKEFTKMALEQEDIAIGHICPKYAIDSLAEDIFRQAIEKNTGSVTRVLVLKESTNSSQKKKIESLCKRFGVSYEEVQ